MNVYGITSISTFVDNPLIRAFHYDMFHGLAERDGKESPHAPHVWASTDSFSPLMISRTTHNVPPICMPAGNLVVNEKIATALAHLPNIRIAEVVFKRLVDIEYRKGDMSWHQRYGHVDPEALLRNGDVAASSCERIGRYFEVHMFRWSDIKDRFAANHIVEIHPLAPPWDETKSMSLSRAMIIQFPLLWWGAILTSEAVFEILDEHIDRDFFAVRKYSWNE